MNANVSVDSAADEVVVMTPEILRALAGLRDLQLHAVGGIAADHGRWLGLVAGLVAAVVGVLALAAMWGLLHPKGRAWRRWRALDRARRDERLPASETTAALAALLREVASSSRAGAMPPGLAGERWLAWLDARAPRRDRGAFLDGAGRPLADLPYLPAGAVAAGDDELFELAARWLWANA